MAEELTIYEAELSVAKVAGNNYIVNAPNGVKQRLDRDVDFGVIPGTDRPTLYKAGAEKICMAYGLMQHYTIESKVEDFTSEHPFCFYNVKCDLVKVATNGQEYIFATGYGSANTREKRNGRNDCYNAANSTLKIAAKRSMVAAALAVSGLSSAFYADMEDEKFMTSNYSALAQTQDPEAPLTTQQMKRIYALAGSIGLNAKQAKEKVMSLGFGSMKDIKQKDYEKVCDLFAGKENG